MAMHLSNAPRPLPLPLPLPLPAPAPAIPRGSRPLPSPSPATAAAASTTSLLPASPPTPTPTPTPPSTTTRQPLARRRSILKFPGGQMAVTWDDHSAAGAAAVRAARAARAAQSATPGRSGQAGEGYGRQPSKLVKPPPVLRGVRFAGEGEGAYADVGEGDAGREVKKGKTRKAEKDTTETAEKGDRKSWVHWPSRMVSLSSPTRPRGPRSSHPAAAPAAPVAPTAPAPPTPTAPAPPSPTGSDTSWHHHPRYFPEYTPLFRTPSPPAGRPRAPLPLTPAEQQAQQHAQRIGHSVVVHYPALPSWEAYAPHATTDKIKAGWETGTFGMAGWNGFGWEGDHAPKGKAGGEGFAKPMPVGEPLPEDQGGPPAQGGKKKK